jgi:hypothetical protein
MLTACCRVEQVQSHKVDSYALHTSGLDSSVYEADRQPQVVPMQGWAQQHSVLYGLGG